MHTGSPAGTCGCQPCDHGCERRHNACHAAVEAVLSCMAFPHSCEATIRARDHAPAACRQNELLRAELGAVYDQLQAALAREAALVHAATAASPAAGELGARGGAFEGVSPHRPPSGGLDVTPIRVSFRGGSVRRAIRRPLPDPRISPLSAAGVGVHVERRERCECCTWLARGRVD